MFDISFTELLVIGAVALVVIGPERLPKVARTIGHLLGRAQRYVSDVKSDIRREMELDELKKFKEQMDDAASSFKSSMRDAENQFRQPLDQFHDEVSKLAADATAMPGTTPAGSTAPDATEHGTVPLAIAETPNHAVQAPATAAHAAPPAVAPAPTVAPAVATTTAAPAATTPAPALDAAPASSTPAAANATVTVPSAPAKPVANATATAPAPANSPSAPPPGSVP